MSNTSNQMNTAETLTIERLDAEIEKLVKECDRVTSALIACRNDRRRLKAKEFIRVNGITKENVETSATDDKPWFYEISHFIEYLRANSTKTWAEWNGQIHAVSDLVKNRWSNTGVCMEDLER